MIAYSSCYYCRPVSDHLPHVQTHVTEWKAKHKLLILNLQMTDWQALVNLAGTHKRLLERLGATRQCHRSSAPLVLWWIKHNTRCHTQTHRQIHTQINKTLIHLLPTHCSLLDQRLQYEVEETVKEAAAAGCCRITGEGSSLHGIWRQVFELKNWSA